ncbi:MarR family winged helix-turn-helix transcriptional regulator [Anaerostipes sp.]|uniref:MarR family winged helix-turn-helix transcriptional regulator n=1 Tax=Anaerostipes sp. TaxID=1872530 RepID=UPI0025C41461|nr:MarR family winged helix-turn-helix transcriptional regulator [Anaerostipes sp.]MBS7007484.1 winged helix-turn-helix transcriptional regulator [Anaerostipes sp.]
MKLEDYDSRHQLFGTLFIISNKLQSSGDRFYKEITTKQWFLLAALQSFEYAPTFNELSALMGSSHQNVKQIALKLEQKGYAEIETDPDDRRKSRIRPGEKFNGLQAAYASKEEDFLNQLYKDIPESKLKTTIDTLNTMLKNMEECDL